MVTVFFTVDEQGFLTCLSSTSLRVPEEIRIELEETHEVFESLPHLFKYVDGKVIQDDQAVQEQIAKEEELRNQPSLHEENQMLKKRLEETEQAVLALMDMQLLGF